jgi:hypothetical protein
MDRSSVFVPNIELRDGVWRSPFSEELEEDWWALFFDTLGTRCADFLDVFMEQLCRLTGERFDPDTQKWTGDEPKLRAALCAIRGMNVQNEAQALFAAHLVALSLLNMTMAARAIQYGGDHRTLATIAKATRAYGDGLLTLQRLQGKGGSKCRQTIKVERRVYYTQVNVRQRGGSENGGQPHGTGHSDDPRTGAGFIEASAAVPGQVQADGQAVPVACGERVPRLSRPRRTGRGSER